MIDPSTAEHPHHETGKALTDVLIELRRVVVGQDHLLERLLVALLARGHILLEGLPGVAKTLAVSTLADTLGGTFVRLQFTPDLLPSDLIGTKIWRASEESFDIEWGPVFANFVLTDEVNRAPAKVQSALLEVMAERQVSVGGTTRSLPDPFMVLATQNPIESEGVYTLPEAQRDRFLMKVVVDYPTPAQELAIVQRMGANPPSAGEVLGLGDVLRFQNEADDVYVDAVVQQYAVDLVMATREPTARGMAELEPFIEFGVSPRATLGLVAAARALALLRERRYATAQDIFDVTRDVFRHRLMLTYEALAQGLTADDIINRILAVVPAAAATPTEADPNINAWANSAAPTRQPVMSTPANAAASQLPPPPPASAAASMNPPASATQPMTSYPPPEPAPQPAPMADLPSPPLPTPAPAPQAPEREPTAPAFGDGSVTGDQPAAPEWVDQTDEPEPQPEPRSDTGW